MKTTSNIVTGALANLAALLVSVAAMAQTPPKVDPVPPKLEKLEEISNEPGVTVAKPEPKNKVVEKRSNGGKVTEAQVKAGNSNYTVKANPEYGNAPKGTVQGDSNRAAQWTILEFGGKKEAKEGNPPDVLPPAAPAKPAPASSAVSK
ncbi:hypothetical protein ACO0K9_06640 [Undibacterium sp. Ji50W]|uniref:hypothetical protein n=1 Tax=Undibacterium sp. Ji50W TaxID=3413041 RepID=UPI003BF259A1